MDEIVDTAIVNRLKKNTCILSFHKKKKDNKTNNGQQNTAQYYFRNY